MQAVGGSPTGPAGSAVALPVVHEQPKAALSRLRLFAIATFTLTVIQIVSGHLGLVTVGSLVVSALAWRAVKRPNTTHLRLFACWNSCMAGFAIAAGIVALLIATPLLSCACDAGCVDAAYDVIQDGRSWVLNNTVNGTFSPARAFNATSGAATFPTGAFFPPARPTGAHGEDPEDEDEDGDARRRVLLVNNPAQASDAVDAPATSTLAVCPHAGHFGKLGGVIGGWLRRHGFGGRHGHGQGHGHGQWRTRVGHRRPHLPIPQGEGEGEAAYNTGIVPPPIGGAVPRPAEPEVAFVRTLRIDRPVEPPMVAVPAVEMEEGEEGDMHILPFPMPDPAQQPADGDLPPFDVPHHERGEGHGDDAFDGVRRHFSPRHHAGLRLRHVFKSLMHALFEPLHRAPRDRYDDVQPAMPVEPHAMHTGGEEQVDSTSGGGGSSTSGGGGTTTTTDVARPHVRRLIAMRRLLSVGNAAAAADSGDFHRKHYPHDEPTSHEGAGPAPGAPGNYDDMMEQRRRQRKYGGREGNGKVDNDWDGDGRSDWEGASEGIDDDGQRALVWFLDWSGALTRPQLHMAAARLCTSGPWVLTLALALIAAITAFHVAAASVARKLRTHPWYVAADARRREECAARRAARRGGNNGFPEPTHLPPAAVAAAAGTAPVLPAQPAADPNVTYRYVPGHGFVPAAATAAPSAPARVWSALTGLWPARYGYERVPVVAADPEMVQPGAAVAAEHGLEMGRLPSGFAVATAAGPRVGGIPMPSAVDVDPKAPIAYAAPAGMYPQVAVATGVPMGTVAVGGGGGVGGWAIAAPVAVGAGAPGAAYTYATMPSR